MIESLKIKALLGFFAVHAGLAISLVALFRQDGTQLGTATFDLLLIGIGLMYSAYLYSVLSVWLQLQPWISRLHRAQAWRTWIFTEIPTILALIPVLVSLLKILKSSWDEIKTHQANGELNVQSLAGVAQKFASEAETLSHDPGVALVKKRLKD